MPLTGSDSPAQQTFQKASPLIAQSLGPAVEQTLLQFTHLVHLDERTTIEVFPSREPNLPLGVQVVCFGRDGSTDSTTLLGLVSDHSGALALIRGVLAAHSEPVESKPIDFPRVIINSRSVERGDLIVDLGFTVGRVCRQVGGTKVYDGERSIFLHHGYEFEVCREWPGRDEFLNGGVSVTEAFPDAAKLQEYVEHYGLDG